MPEPHPPGPQPTADKRELVEAFEQLVTAEEQRARTPATPPPRRRRRAGRVVLLVANAVLYGLLAWLWIAQPRWIFARDTVAGIVSPALREAQLRYAMYLAAHAIGEFASEHGRLPDSLDELPEHADDPDPRLTYDVTGTTGWSLTGIDGEVRLTLRSGDPLEPFLGTSLQLLNATR